MRPKVFLDTETSGLHPERQMWEFAAIRREPNQGEGEGSRHHFFMRINLSRADMFALNVGKYFDRHPDPYQEGNWQQSGTMLLSDRAAALRIAKVTHGATIVGATPDYDMFHISKLLRENGLYHQPWHHRLRCVSTLACGWAGKEVDGLLGAAEEMSIEVDHSNLHGAMYDAELAMAVWDAIISTD